MGIDTEEIRDLHPLSDPEHPPIIHRLCAALDASREETHAADRASTWANDQMGTLANDYNASREREAALRAMLGKHQHHGGDGCVECKGWWRSPVWVCRPDCALAALLKEEPTDV